MPKTIQTHDGSSILRGAIGALYERETDDGTRWCDGATHTPEGTVDVSSITRPGEWQTILLSMVVDGRLYRRWQRRPARRAVSARGLKVLAGRWARDLLRDLRPIPAESSERS